MLFLVVKVSRGEVEVLSGSIVERKMKRFDNFGSEHLFEKKKSKNTLRARTFCEIFLLPTEVFKKNVDSQCDQEMIKKMKDMADVMQKNASKVNKLFGSANDNIPTAGIFRHFIPKSSFRYAWELLIFVCGIFYLFSIPLDFMHYFDGEIFRTHQISFILSYICDFCFVLDVILNFTFFMYYEEGLLISDHHSIQQKFLREHNMVNEFLALVPLDLLGLIHPQWCFPLRMTKVLRLSRVFKSFTKLERALSDFKLEKGLLLLKIGKLNLALVVFCHWIGCLWHACASISNIFGMENNWMKQDEEDLSLSISHDEFHGFGSYLRSVYWAIVGMTTVGYGDIVPTNILETSFATVIILFGGLILPAIVGKMLICENLYVIHFY
jgi:Ion transport protein.